MITLVNFCYFCLIFADARLIFLNYNYLFSDSMLPADNMLFRCAELNAKLESLKAQWSNLYEDATVREQYLAQESKKWQKDKNKINVCILK